MSGVNLPYHLRVKKDIERRLFVEQLRLITKIYDLEKYTYVGMAGSFSEDFKLMNDRFNFNNFISYEINENAYARQKFNLPFTKTNYLNKSMDSFIEEYPSIFLEDNSLEVGKTVLWLDYIGFESKLLQEFEDAIAKVEDQSIIKITLRAHVASLGESASTQAETQKLRVKKVRTLLGNNYFFVDVFEDNKMTTNKFPLTIYELLKKVSIKALRGTNKVFLPISSYTYQDGMKMITFTGIKIKEDEIDNFLDKTGLNTWEYGLFDSNMPLDIEVPFLSLKEKYTFDACFPDEPDIELKYFNDKEINSYKKFHRFYPTFAKIV